MADSWWVGLSAADFVREQTRRQDSMEQERLKRRLVIRDNSASPVRGSFVGPRRVPRTNFDDDWGD